MSRAVVPVFEDITVTQESVGGCHRILRLRVEDRQQGKTKKIVIRTDGLITLTSQQARDFRDKLDVAIATLDSFEGQAQR